MYFPHVQLKWDGTEAELLLTGKAHSATGNDVVSNFIIGSWFSLTMTAQIEHSPGQDFQEKSTPEWTSLDKIIAKEKKPLFFPLFFSFK